MASPSKLFLHNHPVSSYAQKVRIALREKSLPFEAQTPGGLGSGSSTTDLASINPRIEVPTLIDGDFAVFDSTAILAYLEEAYPEKQLLPKSPRERAEARMIEEMCDTHYEAINWAVGEITLGRAEGEKAKALMKQVRHQSGVIHDWLAEKLGSRDYFNGSTFGYADVCVAPIYNRAAVNGYGAAEGSPLQLWHARIQERSSVRDTFDELGDFKDKFAAMGPGFMSGKMKREYRDHRLEFMIKSGCIDIVLEGLKRDNIRFSWPQPAKI
jgi:glutathione S-transferase